MKTFFAVFLRWNIKKTWFFFEFHSHTALFFKKTSFFSSFCLISSVKPKKNIEFYRDCQAKWKKNIVFLLNLPVGATSDKKKHRFFGSIISNGVFRVFQRNFFLGPAQADLRKNFPARNRGSHLPVFGPILSNFFWSKLLSISYSFVNLNL